jgi:hypothetical protein
MVLAAVQLLLVVTMACSRCWWRKCMWHHEKQNVSVFWGGVGVKSFIAAKPQQLCMWDDAGAVYKIQHRVSLKRDPSAMVARVVGGNHPPTAPHSPLPTRYHPSRPAFPHPYPTPPAPPPPLPTHPNPAPTTTPGIALAALLYELVSHVVAALKTDLPQR